MATSLTSAYSGEFLNDIVLQATLGNPTITGGHLNVISGIQKTVYIPRLKATNIIQARAATPSSSGALAYTENTTTLGDYMIYVEFNPNIFADAWRPMQPQGPLLFKELPPMVRMKCVEEILRAHAEHLETAIWQASTTAMAPLNNFDGIFRKAATDSDVIDVSMPVTLTDANIVAELGRVYDAVPVAIRNNPNFKIFLPIDAHEFYGDAQRAKSNKGLEDWDMAPGTFKGKQLVALPGLPSDKMLAGVTEAGNGSNIHLVVDVPRDREVLQVERLQANSELYFFKLLFKAGIAFSYGEELVAYNA